MKILPSIYLGAAFQHKKMIHRPSAFFRGKVSPKNAQKISDIFNDEIDSFEASERLTKWILDSDTGKGISVLTGAGISTASGIPDYRGPNGSYSRGHKPMTHDEFMRSLENRKRYWSRSMVGWERFNQAKPNRAHFALASLENETKRVRSIITQNVDMLHQRAGSKNVVNLHGVNSVVKCMECGVKHKRSHFQAKLNEMNKGCFESVESDDADSLRADGDAEISFDSSNFKLLGCERCGGILKPDVVFFGDNVPLNRVQRCFAEVERADCLLVVGSSLSVYSGFRFVEFALKENKSVAVLNKGPTRADGLPILKLSADCSEVMSNIV
eukprot:CAMPEP_0171464778 /NCGR_PEP_ID=MMETSP0945-20130129/7996_1 /TAXON_ID=109269 /ORGANISM="Vaucheria litorea, Strain CCMP2940" /LENGTH=326 /DNA_ID=CAMNT_0011992005 /DNA_START=54 /DNA_END=1031 /DNA_ORIENTATION=-